MRSGILIPASLLVINYFNAAYDINHKESKASINADRNETITNQ